MLKRIFFCSSRALPARANARRDLAPRREAQRDVIPDYQLQFTAAPSVADASGSEQTLLKVDDDLLAMGLQYAPTSGITPMVLHRRPWPAHWPACVNACGLCAASTPPASVPHQRSQLACCVNVVGLRAASTPPSLPLHRRPPPLTLE